MEGRGTSPLEKCVLLLGRDKEPVLACRDTGPGVVPVGGAPHTQSLLSCLPTRHSSRLWSRARPLPPVPLAQSCLNSVPPEVSGTVGLDLGEPGSGTHTHLAQASEVTLLRVGKQA